jgi:hypothetical protein
VSELPIRFPALGFGPNFHDYGDPRAEYLETFANAEQFTTCDRWLLRSRPRMLVVDSDGASWRIVQVRQVGLVPHPLWLRVLLAIFRQQDYVLDQRLEREPNMRFGDIQDRVCWSIQGNPDCWRDDETIAGEDGPPREEQDLLDELKSRVRAAHNIAGIIDGLWLRSDKAGEEWRAMKAKERTRKRLAAS